MVLSLLKTRRICAIVTLAAFGLTCVPLSLMAQQGKRPGLAVMPLGRRGGVRAFSVKRIEEYLRAMIEAGSTVTLVSQETVDEGKATGPRKRELSKEESRALQQLEKADQAAVTGREMLDSGQDTGTALKLLVAAIKTYEKYFIELADFTKLVDTYNRAAQAALASGQKNRATLYVLRALTLQPSFVVDARRANKDLQTIVTKVRQRLATRSYGVIAVESTQPDSEVFIDGVKLGVAPHVIKDLPIGLHFVQVKKKGAKPWGEAVDVKNRKTVKLHAGLVMEYDPAHDIELMVKPSDVKPFADKGNFHQRVFRNYGFMFARQIQARYLLFGVVAQSASRIELHLFLYDSQIKRTAALQTVYFAGNLSDMQMKILQAEGHVRNAVRAFPTEREVKELPEVYGRTEAAPAVIAPPVTVAPPTTGPTDTPDPDTPEPSTTSPVVRPAPTAPTTAPVKDPYAAALPPADDPDDTGAGGSGSRWWLWTGIGVALAGGGAAAYFLLAQDPTPSPNFMVRAQLPAN